MESKVNDMRSEAPADLLDFGFVKDYAKVWKIQKDLVERRFRREIPDTLVFVEHDHVLTLGRGAHFENVLLKDLPIYEIERGGDVTYHGPGQLVAYPIISLEQHGLGVRQFIEFLESAIVDSLHLIGIKDAVGKLGKDTGVWVGANGTRKIASIGVAVSHWITYHGFALNVNTDLSYFQKIKPCGFDSNVMTSVSKELGAVEYNMEITKKRIANSLSREFGLQFQKNYSIE